MPVFEAVYNGENAKLYAFRTQKSAVESNLNFIQKSSKNLCKDKCYSCP